MRLTDSERVLVLVKQQIQAVYEDIDASLRARGLEPLEEPSFPIPVNVFGLPRYSELHPLLDLLQSIDGLLDG